MAKQRRNLDVQIGCFCNITLINYYINCNLGQMELNVFIYRVSCSVADKHACSLGLSCSIASRYYEMPSDELL